ncbi:MAG: hypothetical protein U1E49_12245 [Hyphomicrobiaceae bacterium]
MVFQPWGSKAIGNRIVEALQLLADAPEFGLVSIATSLLGGPFAILFGMEGPDEFLDEFGCHEPGFQTIQNDVFDKAPLNGLSVGAAGAATGGRAGKVILADCRQQSAARPAMDQPSQ